MTTRRRWSNTNRPIVNRTEPVDVEPDGDLWMSRTFAGLDVMSPHVAQAIARAAVKLDVKDGLARRMGYEQIADDLRTQTLTSTVPITPAAAAPVECVYFIRCGKWVKIGTTTAGAQRRFASMQLPPDAELVGIMHGLGREHEAALHEMFASWRDRGEWFEETAEITALIAANPA